MPDSKDLLAAERTLLAWIRTGIASMSLGFVVARFGLFLREEAEISAGGPTGVGLAGGFGGALLIGVILNAVLR